MEDSMYNLRNYKNVRTSFIHKLASDPETFVNCLYTKNGNRTFSPYMKLNDSSLCCLIGKSSGCSLSTVSQDIDRLEFQGKHGVIYTIDINDLEFVIKASILKDPLSVYSDKPNTSVDILNIAEDYLELCDLPNAADLHYIGSDTFTNEVFNSYLIDFVYDRFGASEFGLNGYVTHYTSTICDYENKRYGLNLMERGFDDLYTFSKSGYYDFKTRLDVDEDGNVFNVDALSVDTITNIVKQIICNLDFLQSRVNFNHNDLKSRNIILTNEPNTINYKGVTNESTFTVKIADFGSSSLTIGTPSGRMRFYNYNKLSNTYLKVSPYKPEINIKLGEPYYTINNKLVLIDYTNQRHTGYPFYKGFDTYIIILSLLTKPEYFYQVISNDLLKYALWDTLWYEEDRTVMYKRVYSMMKNNKENPDLGVLIKMLKGIKLKCDITTIILERLVNL